MGAGRDAVAAIATMTGCPRSDALAARRDMAALSALLVAESFGLLPPGKLADDVGRADGMPVTRGRMWVRSLSIITDSGAAAAWEPRTTYSAAAVAIPTENATTSTAGRDCSRAAKPEGFRCRVAARVDHGIADDNVSTDAAAARAR